MSVWEKMSQCWYGRLLGGRKRPGEKQTEKQESQLRKDEVLKEFL